MSKNQPETPLPRARPTIGFVSSHLSDENACSLWQGVVSDYLAKPIDADRLFSMLRVWLSRD